MRRTDSGCWPAGPLPTPHGGHLFLGSIDQTQVDRNAGSRGASLEPPTASVGRQRSQSMPAGSTSGGSQFKELSI
ncbi:hypothetical protein FHS92_000551 [Sphingobium subterraneum]|uniref:Uncharacterized protein n=1 Tax=Sphingobium subterraneum TaxID=627688 RepID=A0A841IWT9_9SPHN|nr:hypothetical protein [Sphingobium subterraneum]